MNFSQGSPPELLLTGAQVGLTTLTNLSFDPSKNYAGCRICGALFQSKADRSPVAVFHQTPHSFNLDPRNVFFFALEQRRSWSHSHAKLHSEAQHKQLKLSGLWATPEAAERLAAYGVVNLIDLVMDDSTESALRESKAVPVVDAQDTSRKDATIYVR